MNRWGVREHFVYWLFDSSGECLYVGMTRQPEKRWKVHQSWLQRRWGINAASVTKRMAGPYLLETARRIEREQQQLLLPRLDGHDNTRRARSARRRSA